PGNVRELDNVLQRALIIQDGHTITASCLGLEQGQAHRFAGTVSSSAVSSSAGSHSVTVPVTAQEADSSDENRPLGNDLKQREFEIILSTLKQ
ncbi:MAG TPA: sigma-54-dependent Fis family transcriptional regulator, partial [Pseudohongiella sp.]|nr:sigma-54-dependent Fis family transcriptional regulator [Pseudohongiella sp.]